MSAAVGYACFGGAGHQFRMTGIYRLATEAQMFCRRGWIVRPVGKEELEVSLQPAPLGANDPEVRDLLYGEGGILNSDPPVAQDLKKWRGSPPMHLNVEREK